MSNSKSNTLNAKVENTENDLSELNETDSGLDKAIETYKKIHEKEEMSEKEQKEIDDTCKKIINRDIISQAAEHKPTEIKNATDTISTGPPTLTRFEKARIMGSRALQYRLALLLSLIFQKILQHH